MFEWMLAAVIFFIKCITMTCEKCDFEEIRRGWIIICTFLYSKCDKMMDILSQCESIDFLNEV